MVKHFGVTPYMVFDGDNLPSKAHTEASRAKRRQETKKTGLELLKAGKPSQAQLELQKAIDVTPEMARHLIEALKKEGIPYIVAPYEADAQLVYLERQGHITGIISEDSDMLVFGAKRLLTKLDQHGQCIEINSRDFCAVREISLTGWTLEQFRQMTIFSGCDYLEGIPNMGLKTAYRLMRKYRTPERVIRMLQFEGKFRVSENFMAQYKQAELTFMYQRVFCPTKQELVLLTEPSATSTLDIEEMPYIGAKVETELARAIAVGDVNPITKELIVMAALPEKRKPSNPLATTPDVSRLGKPWPPPKPIDSYFKRNSRIPLGNMDRNCFAVDPEQVAALTQNGLTPRVFPLPRPYIANDLPAPGPTRTLSAPSVNRRRTEPITRTLSDLDPSIRSATTRRRTTAPVRRISDISDRVGLVSDTRPSKKARLCEDAETGQSGRSRFFPTGKKAAKAKKTDAYLMSDDSIDEVLANLPDADSWGSAMPSKTRDPLSVFQDEPQVEETVAMTGRSGTKDDDEIIAESPVKRRKQLLSPRDLLDEDDVNSEFDSSAGTPASEVFSQFSYTPNLANTGSGTRMPYGLPTPASSIQESTSKAPVSTTSGGRFRTPLQRIGARALQRGKSISSPLLKVKSPRPARKRRSLEQSLASLPINPAFVPLPQVDVREVEALNKPNGSEDHMYPDSDEENDPGVKGLVEDGEDESVSRLDLSRFEYA